MPHPESEHGLRVQLATALRERDEAREEADKQRARRNLCQTDRDAYELQNEELRKDLAAARREIAAQQAAIAWACGEAPLPDGREFDPALFGHGNTIPRYWWRGPLRLYSALAAPAAAAGEEGKW